MGAPSGTVTFLFTDVEGSTRLWETAPSAMSAAIERHDTLLRSAIEAHQGYVFSTGGDGFGAAFARAGDAIEAAVDAQSGLAAEAWPAEAVIRVRMGLHTGEVVERGGDYFGTAVNQTARLMDLGHGAQVLCSAVTAGLVGGEWSLRDLGEHRLRDLSAPQRVFQLGVEEFSALRSLDAVVGNLPAQLSSFVGREADVAEVVKALGEDRLVTLTGPGGVGKTRLALQAAAELAGSLEQGAWLVELAGLSSGNEVPAAVAAILGVDQQPGRSLWGSVCDACRYRQLLLVLDNAEHLLDDVADQIVELLGSAPGVKVLVTSREALAVTGERIGPVRPLAVENEAVALFADRARAVRPGFEVNAANADAVAEVCQHLDGMPLAIELAAARVGSMTPAEIAGRLDERFRLLRAGRRTRVERHQTLRATIDWSYDTLGEADQQVFAELAVFPSSFTALAAEAVLTGGGHDAWEVVDALDSLTAKSLLTAADLEGVTRYQMLETIRQYAAERLAEAGGIEELRAAHARWVVDFVEQEAGPGLMGPDEDKWIRILEADRDNVAAAVECAVAGGDLDSAMRAVAALGAYAANQYRLGLADFPALVLSMSGVEEHWLYPQVAGAASLVLIIRGQPEAAVALSRRAIECTRTGDWPSMMSRAALWAGLVYLGDAEEAVRVAEGTLGMAEASTDPWVQVVCTAAAIGMLYNEQARAPEELSALATTALGIARRLGNPTALHQAAQRAGIMCSASDPALAIAYLEEAVQAGSDSGATPNNFAPTLGYLSRCYATIGDSSKTARTIRRGVLLARDTGSPTALVQILNYGGQALITLGRYEEGATLLGAAAGGAIAPRGLTGRLLKERNAAQTRARADLREERYIHVTAIGTAMGSDSAITYTLAVLDNLDSASAQT